MQVTMAQDLVVFVLPCGYVVIPVVSHNAFYSADFIAMPCIDTSILVALAS